MTKSKTRTHNILWMMGIIKQDIVVFTNTLIKAHLSDSLPGVIWYGADAGAGVIRTFQDALA